MMQVSKWNHALFICFEFVKILLSFNVCHLASLLYEIVFRRAQKGTSMFLSLIPVVKFSIKVWFCKLILLNCGNVWNSLDIFQYQILPKELGECRKVQWSRFEIKIVLESKFCRNQTKNLVLELNKVHWNLRYMRIRIW